MRPLNLPAAMALVFLAPLQSAFGCAWDFDTLAMEREQFPEAHEFIAGHFLRHSGVYYQWRIEDRNKKPLEERTPLDYDDIAVAQDKLGQQDKAIETMLAKLERWPDERLYESHANLGTFYIHAGQFEKGLEHINNAIEINPDAHFGREVYQKLLVEYLMKSWDGEKRLPVDSEDSYPTTGFAAFVLEAQKTSDEDIPSEIQSAAKGVMGMMRFGQHDSPVLLEVLGDLLNASTGPTDDSKMLAARAYLRASYVVDDADAAAAYRAKADETLHMQYERETEAIEAEFKKEIKQVAEFQRQIAADELAWIKAGKNLDREFSKAYYTAPPLVLYKPNKAPMDPVTTAGISLLLFAVGVVLAVIIGVALIAKVLRNRNAVTSEVLPR